MFFKKKLTPKNHKELVYNHIRLQMERNYMSPKQADKIIKNNQDEDFLQSEMIEEMNYPDIGYLTKRLTPRNIRKVARKPVTELQIIEGVALGDMIGQKYEFTDHNYLSAATEPLPPKNAFTTDDTALTLATYHAILKNPTNPDFRDAYIDAYHQNPNAGYGSSFTNWANNCYLFYDDGVTKEVPMDNRKGYHSYANGCAMRISPIAAYYDDIHEVIKHTITSVMTTHDHVESVKGAVILNVCIWMALHGYSKDEIYAYCREHYIYSSDCLYLSSQFDMSTPIPEPNNAQMLSRKSLFTNYAVPFAIQCFYDTDSYEACMRKILSYYGDTDTICAIAGGLCTAFYGTTGFDVAKCLSTINLKIE